MQWIGPKGSLRMLLKDSKKKKDPRSIFEGFSKDFSKIFEDSFKILNGTFKDF